MNYEKIYNQITNKAKSLERKKLNLLDSQYIYYELHHIQPKCLGGTDENNNLVLLTAREHFICHWLLVRMYPGNDKLAYAFFAMCNKKSKRHQYYTPSSRMYQESRESFSNARIGYEHSQFTKIKMSTSAKKRAPISEDVKLRISNTQKGKITSDEVKLKISNSKKGKVSHRKGKSLPDEVKEKMKMAKILYWSNKRQNGSR